MNTLRNLNYPLIVIVIVCVLAWYFLIRGIIATFW